jgi:hypothetical protein
MDLVYETEVLIPR